MPSMQIPDGQGGSSSRSSHGLGQVTAPGRPDASSASIRHSPLASSNSPLGFPASIQPLHPYVLRQEILSNIAHIYRIDSQFDFDMPDQPFDDFDNFPDPPSVASNDVQSGTLSARLGPSASANSRDSSRKIGPVSSISYVLEING